MRGQKGEMPGFSSAFGKCKQPTPPDGVGTRAKP